MGRRKTFQISKDQRALPFRSSRDAGVLSYARPNERRTLFALIGLVVLFWSAYTYFVMASVSHVALRGEIIRDSRLLSAEVARLETAYLNASNGITESYAYQQGFVAETDRRFIEKTSLTAFQGAE